MIPPLSTQSVAPRQSAVEQEVELIQPLPTSSGSGQQEQETECLDSLPSTPRASSKAAEETPVDNQPSGEPQSVQVTEVEQPGAAEPQASVAAAQTERTAQPTGSGGTNQRGGDSH
jgi:hypothetical protein